MKRLSSAFLAATLCAVAFANPARAADADATGLVPTIWWDFETQPDATGLATANKGSASISFSSEGNKTYQPGVTNGCWAFDTSAFTPYSAAGSFSTAGQAFTVSLVMTLGSNPNGITLNLRSDAGDLIIRRGADAGSLVVGFGPQKEASTGFLEATFPDGDAAYHLVSVVAGPDGTELYVDGLLADASTAFTPWSASGKAIQMQFGSHLNSVKAGEARYGGCIDDLRIHNAALTPSQMQAIAREYGLLLPAGFIVVRTSGEPTVEKNSFSAPWTLVLAPDAVADAAIVYGTDAALASPTTNALGSALAAGSHTASLAGLAAGTTYWWKIVASNGVEWAESDVASFRTLDEIAPAAFSWRVPITVSGYAGASTLTNFPVLVALAAGSPAGFNPADCAADGSDLRFADADGTVLAHEVETWDPNGTSYVWVRVPRLAGTTTQLSLYYGADPAGLPAVAASDVWTRYAAVVHGGGGLVDSSPNALAVANGGGVAAMEDAGIVGGGIRKSANNSIGLNVANPSSSLSNSGQFSVSVWYKRNGNGGKDNNGTHILAANRSGWSAEDGFAILQETGSHISVSFKGGHNWNTGSGALTNQTWGHVAFAYDRPGSMLAAYFNGSPYQTKSNPTTLVNASGSYWTFGSFANAASADSFKGDMDEIRVFDGVASADWIKAEYDSMAAPAAFAVAGAPQPANSDAPRFATTSATVSRSDATFSVTLSNISAATAVSVFYGTDGSTFAELPLGTLSADGTLSATATGLDVGTYVWYARATTTVDGVAYAPLSGRKDFAVTYAKEPTASYKHFTATISYAGTTAAGVPVPLRLSEDAIDGFRYADVTETGFECIDGNGNILPWEIDTWDTNGVSLVWVKVPSYADSATVTVRYGGTFANARPAATEVWSDYIGVWHMSEASGTVADATGHALDATPKGDTQNSIALADGPVGNARQTATSAAKGYLSVPAYDSFGAGDAFTMSGWVKLTACTAYPRLFSRKNDYKDDNGWEMEMSNGSLTAFGARGSGNAPSYSGTFGTALNAAWSHIVLAYDAATLTVYQNGAQVKTGAITAATDNGLPLSIGCDSDGSETYAQGAFDECRLMGGAASADRIAAEYAAMADTNAVSYGAVVSVEMGDPRISAPVVERLSDGTFRVTAEISQNEPVAGSVKCVAGGTEFAMTTADASLPATYSVVLSGLPAGTCTATVQAESAGGTVVSRTAATVFHAGALVVSKVSDADETTLSPGTFRVSRADADPTDLPAISFDVAFSGPGLAAVVAPTVTTLTIPSGAASVDVSVTPVYTTAVDADATLTLAVSGAFIGTPSSGSIDILNATYDPAVRYVATTGDDANHGGTPDLPKKTIAAAVSSLGAIAPKFPCTVHVAPGLYENPSPIVVTNAIRILGSNPDPLRTIVSNTGDIGYYGSHNQRLFTLNHADALVANLTMQKGIAYYDVSGGDFYIGSAGGTVSNCVVEAGDAHSNGHAGGGYMEGGLVTHTVFRRNTCNSGSVSWARNRPGVLSMNGGSRAENCLFADNPQSKNVVLISINGSSVMRNCSIVDTSLSVTNDDCSAWSSIHIATSATVQNVVIAGVTNKVDGKPCPPTWTRANFLNGAFDGDVTGLPEGTIAGTAAAFFQHYAANVPYAVKYRPKSGGPLYNKGANYTPMAAFDLSGKQPRRIGSLVDIGCYEANAAGTIIVVK